MQKFKVDREYVTKEILEMAGNLKGGDLLPDYIELEGELLEGGTVECERCKYGCTLFNNNPCQCPCHNKKEECPCKKRPCVHDYSKEEVKPPEKIKHDSPLGDKINEIIDYLKAHAESH